MPEHITVYCRRHLMDELSRILCDPDYLTAAESAGFDEAAMAMAIRELKVSSAGEITYAGASRPIQVTRHTEREMVRTLVFEAIDELDANVDARIRASLRATTEVVDFELGFQQAEGIGGIIAEQLAFAIAIETEGVIDFYRNEWRSTTNRLTPAFPFGRARDGWGVFDESGFRLEESVYASAGKVPFTVCDLASCSIAIVVEHPRSAELHARLAAAQLPMWIDAIGQATLLSLPDASVARIVGDLVAPADFDRQAFALATAIVTFSHGMFTTVPERYQVRIADQMFTFSIRFDDDSESWFSEDLKQP